MPRRAAELRKAEQLHGDVYKEREEPSKPPREARHRSQQRSKSRIKLVHVCPHSLVPRNSVRFCLDSDSPGWKSQLFLCVGTVQ